MRQLVVDILGLTGNNLCGRPHKWLDTLPEDATIAEAYAACPRGEWLLTTAAQVGINRAAVVQAASACVLSALPTLVHKDASRLALLETLSVVFAYTAGVVAKEDLREFYFDCSPDRTEHVLDAVHFCVVAALDEREFKCNFESDVSNAACAIALAAKSRGMPLDAARLRNANIVRSRLPLIIWPEEVRGET